MGGLRIGFVTGIDSMWRHNLLVAKYKLLHLRGVRPPDVYSLPYFLAPSYTLLRDGEPIDPAIFDLIFSELNGSDAQLEHLDNLVARQSPPVAVIPGPPEILMSVLSHKKLLLVGRILRRAHYVFAYSRSIADFYNGLIGEDRVRVIPWPFDYEAVRKSAHSRPPKANHRWKIILNVPLRFGGKVQNYPFALKAILLDVLADFPEAQLQTLSFHSFVYNKEDSAAFHSSGFGEGLPLILERKRSFASFVQFVSECDAVINLTAANILGRVSFIAAALDKPAILSGNADINLRLYPKAVVRLLDTQQMRIAIGDLLTSLLQGSTANRFLPDHEATRAIGDFSANARSFESMLGTRG